jgi:hypothetical protein
MLMYTLKFDSYDISDPVTEQPSNIAFMMLQVAVMNTNERVTEPDEPKRASTWLAMYKLMTEFATLEDMREDSVPTPDGPRTIKFVVLKPDGGTITLDESAFRLLRRIWARHRDMNLNLGQARQVVITETFLDQVESGKTG